MNWCTSPIIKSNVWKVWNYHIGINQSKFSFFVQQFECPNIPSIFQNTKSFFLSFSWGNVFGLICKVLRILPTHAFLIKVKQKCVNNWQINFFQFFFINHCLTDCYKIKVQVGHFSRVNIVNESHFRSAINEILWYRKTNILLL